MPPCFDQKIARSTPFVKPLFEHTPLNRTSFSQNVCGMKPHAHIPFENLVSAFTAQTNLRVWSVLVSLLGDLVREEKQELSNAVVTTTLGHLGIRPEAVRVALHRLKKDDWITTRKLGRSSYVSLSAQGRKTSIEAAKQIYDFAPISNETWHILISQNAKVSGPWDDKANGYLSLGSNVWFGKGNAPKFPEILCFEGHPKTLPNWIIEAAFSDDLIETSTRLETALRETKRYLKTSNLNPLEQIAIRVLVVHEWRKLLFRLPPLPETSIPKAAPIASCRRLTQECLDLLPKVMLSILNDQV